MCALHTFYKFTGRKMTSENTPDLVVGSAWQRLKNHSMSTVLALTNVSLREELQERFPPQVVFTTSSGAVLSQDIPTFLKTREYVGMDEHVVKHMNLAIDGPMDEEEEDSEVDIDSIDPDADQDAETTFGDLVESGSDSSVEDEDTIPVFEPAVFDGLQLDDHFISYSEAPGTGGDTLHIVRFALDDTLNLDQMRSIFSAASELTVEEFVIDSEAERTHVNIAGYLPVFLEVDAEGNGVAAVYVTSTGDFRAAQAAAELEAAITSLRDQEVLDVAVQDATVTVIPQVKVQPVVLNVTAAG